MVRSNGVNPTSPVSIAPGMQIAPRRHSGRFVLASSLLALGVAFFAPTLAFAQDPPAGDEPPPPPPPVDEPPPPPAPSTVEPDPPPPPTTTAPAPPPPPPPVTAAPPPPPPPATTTTPRPPPPAPTTSPKPAPPPSARPSNAPPPPPAAKKEDDEDDTNGLFGPFRIGPVIGVGVPNLVSFGATAKLTRFLGFGVNVGVIPKVQLSLYGDATLSYQEYDAYGRLYPFGGSFFLGAGVGYATMKGSYVNDLVAPAQAGPLAGTPITITTDGSVRSLVLTPQLGFFKTWGSGISLGIDFGAQVPIAPSTVTANTSVSVGNDLASTPEVQERITQGSQKVRETLDKVGQQIVPTINIKLGFLL